jgi:DNA-binding IclR family transcriptional regulator
MRELLAHPTHYVSLLAQAAGIGESAASQELRRLQSRGLLRRHQAGGRVYFWPIPDPQVSSAAPLLEALIDTLNRYPADEDVDLCRLAMGLAHERRIQIARILAKGPIRSIELQHKTGIPRDALQRHLQRMQDAGLLQVARNRIALIWPRHPLARALSRLVSTATGS